MQRTYLLVITLVDSLKQSYLSQYGYQGKVILPHMKNAMSLITVSARSEQTDYDKTSVEDRDKESSPVQLDIHAAPIVQATDYQELKDGLNDLKNEVHSVLSHQHNIEEANLAEDPYYLKDLAHHEIHEKSLDDADNRVKESRFEKSAAEAEGQSDAHGTHQRRHREAKALHETEKGDSAMKQAYRTSVLGEAEIKALADEWRVEEELEAANDRQLEQMFLDKTSKNVPGKHMTEDVKVSSLLNAAKDSEKKAFASMREAQKDEKDNLVRREFTRRMVKIEDCPPGWVSIKEKTKEPTNPTTPPILEPCPIAVMEEPCPCIRELFEGSSKLGGGTLEESISEDRPPPTLEESIEEDAALDCVDVYRDLRNQYGEDMAKLDESALAQYRKHLDPKFRLRLVKS